MSRSFRWTAAVALVLLGAVERGHAQTQTDPTAALLAELIRVNTSNPPGNEDGVAQLLAPRFRAAGFEVHIIATPEPGKAHFIARLRGNGSRRPILLAGHADVVGVEREKWSLDPFAGVIKDGYVFGRGALDFKGGLAVFAQAALMLAERKIPLDRDVILLAEADEESGSYGPAWLARERWDLIDCEFALNEGGWIIKRPDGRVRYVSISTADKSSVSFVLTARGTSTHSSMPRPDNAIFRLGRALTRLSEYRTPVQLTPATRQFFLTLAKTSDGPMAANFRNLVSGNPALVRSAERAISKDPLLNALMRNTIAPVLMNAGFRGNVIPGSAEATINVRLIPGADREALLKEFRRVVADSLVEIRPSANFTSNVSSVPVSSDTTALYRALVTQARAEFPDAEVTSYLFQAGTDAPAWRSRGVPVYGIYPYAIDSEDLTRMHGNDERVSVESLRRGTQMIFRTLVEVAGGARR